MQLSVSGKEALHRREAHDEVYSRDRDGYEHDREAVLHETAEGDLVTVLLGNVGHDDVRRRADQGAVAAEAGAE